MNSKIETCGLQPPCDIVLPVFNGLTYVRDCVHSIIAHTKPSLYYLHIVDDCSDAWTRERLVELASHRTNLTLYTNPENLGFVKSCNRAMSLGAAPFVVIINSDVVVTPGWLERLLRCAASDEQIASVNPLTNYASQISVPIPPGVDFFALDAWLAKTRAGKISDVVTGVGFCILLRRSALEDVGFFDECYGQGYCEDSDLCMRLTARGYRTVVAEDVYVYHKGRSSFTDRDERYRKNRKIFDQRWAAEYERRFRAFLKKDPLGCVRRSLRFPLRPDPMPAVWKTGRRVIDAWRRRDPAGLLRACIHGVREIPFARREIVTPERVRPFMRPGKLRVTYVLHNLVVAGGVLSVIQLVNELLLLGVEARIAALFEDPEIYDWTRLYTRPMVFRNFDEMISQLPPTDIAVATLWTTAAPVRDLVARGKAKQAVYFLQDYEAWFFSPEDKKARQKVIESYGWFRYHIAKSDWLCRMVAQHGCRPRKIRLGMDLSTFYPRDLKDHPPTVLAMARPQTPRRGFSHLVEILGRLHRERPDVEIVLFGDRFLSTYRVPFPYRDEGVVINQERLARLYSESDIFLDASDFQGFGRCGLEAMACGTTCVLTGVGGVEEYAKNGENCLLVPPGDRTNFLDAVLRLLHDSSLRARLSAAGLKTAQAFCHKREARETLAFFEEIAGRLQKSGTAPSGCSSTLSRVSPGIARGVRP